MRPDVEAFDLKVEQYDFLNGDDAAALIAWVKELEADVKTLCAAIDAIPKGEE